MAASAIAELLGQRWPDVPAECLSYLAAGLAEDDEQDEDELADCLAGYSPAFGGLEPAEQRRQVQELLRDVAALRGRQRGSAAAAATGPAAAASAAAAAQTRPLAAVVSETLSRLGSLSVSGSNSVDNDGGGLEGDLDCGPAGSRQLTAEQQEAVRTLRELSALEGTSDAFLAHVLVGRGSGDVQAAAAWMLECPDLPAAQAAWDAGQRQRAEERRRAAEEREAAKKQIVSRFQLQAVPDGGSTGAAAKGRAAIKAWGAADGKKAGQEEGRVRYRDGMVATRAGQKYVVERVGEEWDGGSRGKVYTKGKRGKGFA